MIFKITYGTQIHVLTSKKGCTLQSLIQFIQKVFKNIPNPLGIYWGDSVQQLNPILQEIDMMKLSILEAKIVKIYLQTKIISDCQLQAESQNQQEILNKDDILYSSISEQNQAFKTAIYTIKSRNKQNQIRKNIQMKIQSLLPQLINQIQNQVKAEQSLKKQSIIEDKKSQIVVIESKPLLIHENVFCSKCSNNKQIEGIRYTCTYCDNYNMCEKCEQLDIHEHALLKIRTPEQTPLKVITYIYGDKQLVNEDKNIQQVYECHREGIQEKKNGLSYKLLMKQINNNPKRFLKKKM